jgi:hypothetical protein
MRRLILPRACPLIPLAVAVAMVAVVVAVGVVQPSDA